MTRAAFNTVQRAVGKKLDREGEVGPIDTLSDDRLRESVIAGSMMEQAASSPMVAKIVQGKHTAG